MFSSKKNLTKIFFSVLYQLYYSLFFNTFTLIILNISLNEKSF